MTAVRLPILAALVLMTACNEQVLTKTNDPPVVVIQSPTEGAMFSAGDPISFQGKVADDGDLAQIQVSWIDNGSDVLLSDQVPDDEGFATFTTADLDVGVHAITMRAVDAANLSHEDAVTIEVMVVDETPLLTIVHPTAGERAQQDVPFLFEVEASDPQDDPQDLVIDVTSDLDGFVCSMSPDTFGSAVCRVGLSTVGAHRITFVATDLDGNTRDRRVVLDVDPVAQAPSVVVVAPQSGATVRQGTLTTFEIDVDDQQDAPTALTASMTSSVEGALCTFAINAQGRGTCFATLATPGSQILSITVVDTDANEGTAQLSVLVADGNNIDDDGDGYTENGGDCNDNNPNVSPGAPELPNGVDDNCNDDADEGTVRYDDDGDGYCEAPVTPCTDGSLNGDCDDNNPFVHPAAQELCADTIDNNCNTQINEPGASDCRIFYFDGDSDSFGIDSTQCRCTALDPYDADNDDDCNDANANVYPGATELPDGLDNNCNLTADEGTSLYDDDGDGYCDSPTQACTDGSLNGDCNDGAAAVNPGAAEICLNGVDDNCSTAQDEPGALGCTTYWLDGDGDGFGNPATEACACTPPANSVGNGTDCNDAVFTTNPGAAESPDGLDNNCNGVRDEGTVLYDDDGDGYCEATTCTQQDNGTRPLGNDCDDANPGRNPAATEICGNSVDDNCNNAQNEGLNSIDCDPFFRDDDGDGYGDATDARCYCQPTAPYTGSVGGDCYDDNANAKPGQTQWFNTHRGDGSFDYNCSGTAELKWPDEAQCLCEWDLGPITIPLLNNEAGWEDGVPACGVTDTFLTYCEYPTVEDQDVSLCLLPVIPINTVGGSLRQQCH